MSEADRKKLSDFIGNHGGNAYSTVLWAMVALMVVGGVLVIVSLVIGLIAWLTGRRSETVWCHECFAVIMSACYHHGVLQTCLGGKPCIEMWLAVWLNVNALISINDVALCRVRLAL